uniref:WD40 repeat-containing protein SMU1 n=1 Tax=Lotharella vacuolata TaxID=74820 RepID=A0A0H5BGW2_9EUKA|nr:hypothetical protein [Lotharella vacuolata]
MKNLQYSVIATASIFSSNINLFTLLDNFLLLTFYKEFLIFYDLIKKKILKKITSSSRYNKTEYFLINHFFTISKSFIVIIILTNGMIFAWNFKSNKCLFSLSTNGISISSSIILYNKKMIILGDLNGIVTIWSITDKKKILHFNAHQQKIYNIKPLFNEEYMLTSTFNTIIKVWNLKKISCVAIFKTYTIQKISISINPHLNIMLSTFNSNSLIILYFFKDNINTIRIKNYKCILFKSLKINLPILTILYTFLKKIFILKLGNKILYNIKIKIFTKATNIYSNTKKLEFNIKFFSEFYIKMLQLVFFHDVKFYNYKILYKKLNNSNSLFLIFISTTFNIYILLKNKKKIIVLELLNFFIHKSNIIYSSYSLNKFTFFTITKKILRSWTTHKLDIRNINFLNDISSGNFYLNDNIFLYGNTDGFINYLNTNNNYYKKICYGHNDKIYTIITLQKKNFIFSYSINKNLKIWRNKFLKKNSNFSIIITLFKSLVFNIEPVELLINDNETHLLISFINRSLKLYLIPSIKYCFSFDTTNEIIITSCFSTNNAYLLGGSLNGYIFIWKINSSIILFLRRVHKGPVQQLKYFKNNKIIISLGIEKYIIICSKNLKTILKKISFLQKNPFMLLINNQHDFIISIGLDYSLRKLKIIISNNIINSKNITIKKKNITSLERNFFRIFFNIISRKPNNNILLEYIFYRYCTNSLKFFNLIFIGKILMKIYKKLNEFILKLLLKWIISYKNINLVLNLLSFLFIKKQNLHATTQRCFFLLNKIHLICLIYIKQIRQMIF